MRGSLTHRAAVATLPVTATSAFSARFVIALMAFLTVADLFATQAILPALTAHYRVSPATMGLAVNACTFGMAAAGLAVALFSRYIDRRCGIVASLALLAIPTVFLAVAPDVPTFAAFRIAQGVLMATAFSLTLAYLGEQRPMGGTAGAIAAYITGNVASNLFGRLLSASVAESFGLASSFAVFAALNMLGAGLAWATLRCMPQPATNAPDAKGGKRQTASWLGHLHNPTLRATFAIGFCILFAFIGTFTYVNFVLVRPPLSLGMMQVGLVYFVFLPSIVTTPMAGRLAAFIGDRHALWLGLAIALAGLPLLLLGHLAVILVGLALLGVGTFLAQAVATGLVGRAAKGDPGSASGLYLASYFLGGLCGSAILGQIFVHIGWPATVGGIALALLFATALALQIGALRE